MTPFVPTDLSVESTEDKQAEDLTIDTTPFDDLIGRLKGIQTQLEVILKECRGEE